MEHIHHGTDQIWNLITQSGNRYKMERVKRQKFQNCKDQRITAPKKTFKYILDY